MKKMPQKEDFIGVSIKNTLIDKASLNPNFETLSIQTSVVLISAYIRCTDNN